MDTRLKLDELLSETPNSAQNRVARELDWFDTRQHPLILYGAGTLGSYVLSKLQQIGIKAAAFADDTPGKQGTTLHGVPIKSPSDAASNFGPNSIFVVTILNPQLSFLQAKSRLNEITKCRVVSVLSLFWKFPDAFLPYCQFQLPGQLLEKATNIRAAFDLWSDEESRRQFVDHLQFRLLLDHHSLPPSNRQGYFPDFISLENNTIFVDCGAYDGDSIREFLKHQQNYFERIYAFEPDEKNFERLESFVDGLPPHIAQKISVYKAGVGERRTQVKFNVTGDMSASQSSNGSTLVQLLPLDEVVDSGGNPVFLKLDIEGTEWQALQGAQSLLEKDVSQIAISVYHRPDDLWELPLHISGASSNYELFLRTQGEDGMDVICYAVRR